jgi:outer membrane immunogenic protein
MKAKLFLALAVLSAPALASAEGGLNGPFIGGYLGNVDGTDTGKETAAGTPDGWTQKTSPSGAVYGLLGGYNWVFGNNLVLGVEADYEARSAYDKSVQKDSSGVPNSNYPVKTELNAAYSLRAKFGYAFNAKTTLVYVTAGYAAADIKRTFTSISGAQSVSDSGWQDGTTVGLGVEQLFKEHISARVEYRYADYGDTNVNTASIMGPGFSEVQSYTEQSLRVGVAYKF